MATVAKDRCNVCDKKFKLTSENTVVYIFTKPDFAMYSYLETVCSHCRAENGTFMTDHLEELVEIAKITECDVNVCDYPSENLMYEWCEVYGVKLKQHQLTGHEERQIGFMHFLLSADDRSIWAEFE